MKLTESLLHALKAHGAREVFGIPGDFALPYFKVMEDSGILPIYTMSHEPAVGFAADAAARYRGGLSVAAVTYGAGALNMVNAIAQAYAEKSPVVVISGAPGAAEAHRGLLLHHQAKTLDSQYRIFSEVTCAQAVLDDPAKAPAEIARVLASAVAYSQPVYIEIPRDMAAAPCGPVPPAAQAEGLFPVDQRAVEACAQAVLERIAKARRPMVMVGVEVRRFGLEDKVERLVRALGLPVATSFMGRGLLACYEDLAGTYLGVAGDPAITEAVENADQLILLGVILSDTNFGVSAKTIDLRRTIQMLDRQVRMDYHVYPDMPLDRIIDAMLAKVPAAQDSGGACIRGRRELPGNMPADDAPLTPQDMAAALNDLLEAHGRMPIASDVGDCLFTAMSLRQTPMVAPGYYASMGFGVPAGLGIQVSTGERPLILVGDGAFQMTGLELGHCARHGLDPVVIVFNNNGWELLRAFQPTQNYFWLGDWHYARLAEALGGVGHRAATRREFAQALQAAHAGRGRLQLIEAMLPRGALSEAMGGFVASVSRVSRPS